MKPAFLITLGLWAAVQGAMPGGAYAHGSEPHPPKRGDVRAQRDGKHQV